jgi:uncharacterized protein
MKDNILGRIEEQETLKQVYNSDQSEFVAICGRRRVGKTFLIREYFEGDIAFQCSGLSEKSTKEQLRNFYMTLRRYDKQAKDAPTDWLDAFDMLIDYLESIPVNRKIVFLDELPWMDTSGSDFIPALEHFWNGWASARHDIVLIVCGSATSWMMDNLINNHGGLYGRLTNRIFLQPFNLGESEIFLKTKGINLSRYETAECYMILGGIPYYLNYLDSRISLAQNIDRLLFNPNGKLYDEFNNLYSSLFKGSENYVKVVSALSKKGKGLTRKEIINETGILSGNGLTTILENLGSCGFIRKYINYGSSTRNSLYQLIDFFTLFYFRFLSSSSFRNLQSWAGLQRTPSFYAWAGYSFELLSLIHVDQIKKCLGISGVLSKTYSWRSISEDSEDAGSQVDLVIDRNDNTINLCEMKFSENEFSIDKDYEKNLRNKIATFMKETKSHKSIQLTFVTTYGVKKNSYSGIMQNEILLDDLY